MQQPFDAVVVGAGPAGSSAALEISRAGARVLMLDYKKYAGIPVQCAEYVPRQMRSHLQFPPGAIVQRIERMSTYISEKLCSDIAAPGYVLNREVFDRWLAEQALVHGSELWLGTKAMTRTAGGLSVLRQGRLQEIKCRYIVGADGPRSTVGKWMNSTNQKFMVAIQWTVKLCEKKKAAEIYFSPEYTGAYAWLFPRQDYANLGVGIITGESRRLPSLFKALICRMIEQKIIEKEPPLRKTGGLVPIGGPLAVTVNEGMLLAGDAAGQTHPITGGGIMNAVTCGQMAGQAIVQALQEKKPARLSDYSRCWQDRLGKHLDIAARQRLLMDREWTREPQAFERLIRHCWLACT